MSSDEKRFTALGEEWVARFDFNSVCELEDRYDKSFLAIVSPMLGGLDEQDIADPAKQVAAASKIRMSDVRAILRQSLVAKHPGITAEDVGNIIGDIGLDAAMQIVAWAVVRALPKPKGGKGKADKNPL